MKKAPEKVASAKPWATGSDSFINKLSESQQLQRRLHALVEELKDIVTMLEQNLKNAHRSAQQREIRDQSDSKADPPKATNEPGNHEPQKTQLPLANAKQSVISSQ